MVVMVQQEAMVEEVEEEGTTKGTAEVEEILVALAALVALD